MSAKNLRIAINGIMGKMGHQIVQQISLMDDSNAITLAGGIDINPEVTGNKIVDIFPFTRNIDEDAKIVSSVHELAGKVDVIVDFSRPLATLNIAKFCAEHKVILISGTTGFEPDQWKELEAAAKKATIVWSSNMSIGINLLMGFIEKMASLLGEEYDIEILEMHHNQKVDAPSGTAISLGEAAARGRKQDFSLVAKRSRDGNTEKRKKGEIGFASLRGGDVIGDHKVIFAGDGERIELGHIASNRSIFAKGAILAAIYAKRNLSSTGLYGIKDLFGV